MDVVHVGDEVHVNDTGMIRDRHVFVPAEHTDAFAAEPKVNATKQIARLGCERRHSARVGAVDLTDSRVAARRDAAPRNVIQPFFTAGTYDEVCACLSERHGRRGANAT
jgi:hypothetical protein